VEGIQALGAGAQGSAGGGPPSSTRERLDDIYRELKYLVAATQKRDVAGNIKFGKLVGQQKRLELALAFVDDPLPKTREVASAEGNHVLQAGLIEAAAAEIAEAIDRSFTS
jgi:hypothetical protein